MTRLKKIDDGHYLVPGTDWELVVEPDMKRWAVWRGNEKLQVFPTYELAREWAITA